MDGGSPTRRLKTPEALAWSDLPPVWEDFLRFHTSPESLQAVVRLFEPQLLRCLGPSHLVTDCQFVLNDPVAKRVVDRRLRSTLFRALG